MPAVVFAVIAGELTGNAVNVDIYIRKRNVSLLKKMNMGGGIQRMVTTMALSMPVSVFREKVIGLLFQGDPSGGAAPKSPSGGQTEK